MFFFHQRVAQSCSDQNNSNAKNYLIADIAKLRSRVFKCFKNSPVRGINSITQKIDRCV